MQVVADCLHFVMSYMKQNKKRKQTLESAQYGLEIIFEEGFLEVRPSFSNLQGNVCQGAGIVPKWS